MANINLDFSQITSVAGILTAANSNIGGQVTSLKTTVDAMLQKDGGLWMKSTSPAFQSQYEQFNSSAVQVVAAIAQFSAMFSGMAAGMASMDQSYAFQILHPNTGS